MLFRCLAEGTIALVALPRRRRRRRRRLLLLLLFLFLHPSLGASKRNVYFHYKAHVFCLFYRHLSHQFKFVKCMKIQVYVCAIKFSAFQARANAAYLPTANV